MIVTFYKEGGGSERLSSQPRVPQLVSGRAAIQI